MRKGKVVIFFLVLLVISLSLTFSLSSLSSPVIINVQFPMIDMESETHTLIQKVALFTGLYEPQPPSGSNPSFLIRNSTGSNMFEVDHDGRGRVMGNFTVGNKLTFNDTMNADCPKIYVNSSGCLISESCTGSRIAVCD